MRQQHVTLKRNVYVLHYRSLVLPVFPVWLFWEILRMRYMYLLFFKRNVLRLLRRQFVLLNVRALRVRLVLVRLTFNVFVRLYRLSALLVSLVYQN